MVFIPGGASVTRRAAAMGVGGGGGLKGACCCGGEVEVAVALRTASISGTAASFRTAEILSLYTSFNSSNEETPSLCYLLVR